MKNNTSQEIPLDTIFNSLDIQQYSQQQQYQLIALYVQLRIAQQTITQQYVSLIKLLKKLQLVLGQDFQAFITQHFNKQKEWIATVLKNTKHNFAENYSDVFLLAENNHSLAVLQKHLKTIAHLEKELLTTQNKNYELQHNLQAVFIKNDQLNNLLKVSQNEIHQLQQSQKIFNANQYDNTFNVLLPIVERLRCIDINTIEYTHTEKRTILSHCDEIVRHLNNLKTYL